MRELSSDSEERERLLKRVRRCRDGGIGRVARDSEDQKRRKWINDQNMRDRGKDRKRDRERREREKHGERVGNKGLEGRNMKGRGHESIVMMT